jgi:tRNA U34 5-methylaminomethyl-2-thiouridine-forming methyltransferase MnmC
MGRPSEYREEFCQTAVDCLSKGYSLSVLAGELDVSRQTVDAWMKAHPEFLDAVSRGRAKGARVWEDRLARASDDKAAGNPTAITFALKNVARDDWSDTSKQELSGPDGGAVATVVEWRVVDPAHRDT